MTAFLIVATQWRTSFGGLVGLDYTAVKQALDASRIRLKSVLPGLQVLESEVLRLSAEKAEKADA